MLIGSNNKELPAVPRKLSKWISRGRRSFGTAMIILGLRFADAPALRPEVVDRLVAVVNRQIITFGDVEQELRFQTLQPDAENLTGTGSEQKQNVTQELVVQHLIEQTLIREQIQQFPGLEIEDEQVDTQLAAIEKKIGGKEKLAEMKIDLQTLKDRLRWQLQVIKFVDYRFRQFVVVDSKEIEAYYQNQFLPELGRRSGSAQPELNEVEEPIRKILTEEKVNTEVEEWLASLRKDATIEIFH